MLPDVFMARCHPAYDAVPGDGTRRVRQALRGIWSAMGFDPDNPFKDFLGRGSLAVIKPNWVMHCNAAGHGLDCLVTHASLIYYLADWCAAAMDGRGRIIVGDAPIQSCRFDALQAGTGMPALAASLRKAYPDIDLSIEDWRLTIQNGDGREAAGCAAGAGFSELDCGADSFLEEVAAWSDRFRVGDYNPDLLQPHHRPGVHTYLVRNDVLDADLLINAAKMKTHKKAGLTGALKNLVGINGHKEYLPHYIRGAYANGGDSCCRHNRFACWAEELEDRRLRAAPERLRRSLLKAAHDALCVAARLTGGDGISNGSWAGNDTVWRTTLDLNHLVYFGGRRPGRVLSVVDGIVAGQGDGPLRPEPRPAGVILAGENPACIDAVIGKLMGYAACRLPTVYQALRHRGSKFAGPPADAVPVCFVGGAEPHRRGSPADIESMRFVPPRHWRRAVAP